MAASVNTMRILLDSEEPRNHLPSAAWPSQGTIYFEFCEPIAGDQANATLHGILFSPPDMKGNRTALVPLFSQNGLTVRGININPNSFQPVLAPVEDPSPADRTALRHYRHLMHLPGKCPNAATHEPAAASPTGSRRFAQPLATHTTRLRAPLTPPLPRQR